MNPVTLKELRQLTRSRTIAGAIVAFFLVQLVAAALVVVAWTDKAGELRPNAGHAIFGWLAAVLAPILVVVVPGNLFARLVSEHGPGRTELLAATALRPSALVNGKIRSGLALVGLFLAGALPFLLLSYLLGGLDVLLVLAWAFAAVLAATVAVHLSVFLASLRLPAAVRWSLWALCAVPAAFFALPSALWFDETPWKEWEFLAGLSACAASVCLLLRGFAVACLAPPATDRVRPLRLTAAAVWAAWVAFAVVSGCIYRDPAPRTLAVLGILGIPLLALAAFDLSSPSGPTRRVLLDRPRSRLRRLLRFPFSTGAESGLAFSLLFFGAGAAATALAALAVCRFPLDWDDAGGGSALQVLLAYVLDALLLSRALLRIPILARRIGLRFAALLAAAIVGLAMLLPNLISLGGSFDPELSPLNLAGIDFEDFRPVSTGSSVLRAGPNIRFHARWAAILLALGLLLHVRPFLRSFRAYVR